MDVSTQNILKLTKLQQVIPNRLYDQLTESELRGKNVVSISKFDDVCGVLDSQTEKINFAFCHFAPYGLPIVRNTLISLDLK